MDAVLIFLAFVVLSWLFGGGETGFWSGGDSDGDSGGDGCGGCGCGGCGD